MRQIEKFTKVVGSKPLASDLAVNEIAINMADKKAYIKRSSGVVMEYSATKPQIFNTLTITARDALPVVNNGDYCYYSIGTIRYLDVYYNGWVTIERTTIPLFTVEFQNSIHRSNLRIWFSGGEMEYTKDITDTTPTWTTLQPGAFRNISKNGADNFVIREKVVGQITRFQMDDDSTSPSIYGGIKVSGGVGLLTLDDFFHDMSKIKTADLTEFYTPIATTAVNLFKNCRDLVCVTNLDTRVLDKTTLAKDDLFNGCGDLDYPTSAERALLQSVDGYNYINPNVC